VVAETGRGPVRGRAWSTAAGRTVAEFGLAPLALLLTMAGAAVRRPSALVAITVLLICVPVQLKLGGSILGPGDLASVLLVGAAALSVARGRGVPGVGVRYLFGALLLTAAIATLNAFDPVGSLVGLLRYVQLFVVTPLAVVVATRWRSDGLLIAQAAIGAALIQGVVGVWQYVTRTGAVYAGQPIRAVGTFGATDVIAMSVVVGIGLVAAVGLALGATGRRRAVYAAIATALVVPLGLSLSRGSWIATALAVLVVLVAAGGRVLVALAVGAAVATILIGGVGVGSSVVEDRLASITSSVDAPDSSVSDRYDLWMTAVGIWADHPFSGVGIKAFPDYRDSYAPLGLSSGSDIDQVGLGYQRQELLSPHNQYLLILAEQGALGAVAFVTMIVLLTASVLIAARRAPPELRGIAYVAVGLVVWQGVQFLYGDLGGATSLMTSMSLGLAARWGMELRRATEGARPR
jgi:O-antigen ligase